MIQTQGCYSTIDLEQGSDEWLAFRKNHITATDALIIMGLSPWRTREELLKEKLGLIEPKPKNYLMERGKELEPIARSHAEENFGTFFIPEVCISNEYPWMMASTDGISFDGNMLLEIKCPGKKAHEIAKAGSIPDYYMPQLQHQMAVCGFDECIYFSFDGSEGVTVVVQRDDVYIADLLVKEKEFYDCLINKTTKEHL